MFAQQQFASAILFGDFDQGIQKLAIYTREKRLDNLVALGTFFLLPPGGASYLRERPPPLSKKVGR